MLGSFMNKRGGKRENSGRKRSENKKIRVSFSLAPDVVEYLNSRTDKPKAQIIEDAIRVLKGNPKTITEAILEGIKMRNHLFPDKPESDFSYKNKTWK